ncbi:MAG: trypsin-like peptidase domain-containing protein, partial [Clostridia bacterium]|nr:trypsin-like peptidase domain-containing protein [Clostridia bacterium]
MNDDFDYKPEESSEPEAPEAQENGAAEAPYTDVFSGENTETVDFEAEAAAAAADAANDAAAETEAKAYEAADNMGYVPPEAPAAAEEPAGEPAPAYTQPEPEIPVVEAERTGPSAPYNANPYSYGQPGAQNQGYQYGYQYGAYRQPVQQEPAEPPKKGKGKKIFLSIIALILVFALGVGTSSLFGKTRNFITPAKEGTSEATTVKDDTQITISATPSASKASGAGLTAAQIAEKLSPSNVGILVYSDTAGATASGEGSGIVMGTDKSGQYTYIVTCAHILNTAGTKFKVQTVDGTLYDAESVGYDTRTDVGVIKVKAANFKPAEFGNSDDHKVGDPVYAIGNPGGTEFFGSFTGGFVSAINRPINSEIGY